MALILQRRQWYCQAVMEASTRTYRSPLREAQASQTRTLILDAYATLLASSSGGEVPVRRLAAEAGVSERTVYRYFPDREALVEGLWDLLSERSGTDAIEEAMTSAWDICRAIPRVFSSFDADPEVTKAGLLLDPDPAHDLPSQRQRSARFRELLAATFPELAADDLDRLGAIVRTFTTSMTWLRMREQFGLPGAESGALLGWAAECVLREVERTGRVGWAPGVSGGIEVTETGAEPASQRVRARRRR